MPRTPSKEREGERACRPRGVGYEEAKVSRGSGRGCLPNGLLSQRAAIYIAPENRKAQDTMRMKVYCRLAEKRRDNVAELLMDEWEGTDAKSLKASS